VGFEPTTHSTEVSLIYGIDPFILLRKGKGPQEAFSSMVEVTLMYGTFHYNEAIIA
jgi:hypothetical protein